MLSRGRISYFTHPPETHTLPTHVSAEIVMEMGKAFDWDELEKGNQEVIAGKRKCLFCQVTRKAQNKVLYYPEWCASIRLTLDYLQTSPFYFDWN